MLAKYFYLYRFILVSKRFPFLATWLIPFARWLLTLKDRERVLNDSVYHILRYFRIERFVSLETSLSRAGKILGLRPLELATEFRLLDEKDKNNAQKLGDLLAEINTVLALDQIGYRNIKKIPESSIGKRIDFVAEKEVLWGIEVKNIRLVMDDYETRMSVARGETAASWHSLQDDFSQMRQKISARLKHEKQSILDQFAESADAFGYQRQLLVFHTHDTFFLSQFPHELEKLLAEVKAMVPEISHVGISERGNLQVSA